MIKTSIGTTIDSETLLKQLQERISLDNRLTVKIPIACQQEDDLLVFLIDDSATANEIEILIDLIAEIIDHHSVVNDFTICNSHDRQQIYAASKEDYLAKNELEKSSPPEKKYSSANFSSGFVIFIFSVLSVITIGVVYYFSRPCVMEKCEIITSTEATVSDVLKTKSTTDLTEANIVDLKAELVTAIKDLQRIPRWSDSFVQASQLIESYRDIINDLNYFLEAYSQVERSENMRQQLPLSLKEWTRVQSYLEKAIEELNMVSTPDLIAPKEEKIESYQGIIYTVNNRIEAEKTGIEKLANAQIIVQEIKANQQSINSLSNLEQTEQQWQNAISKIEEIPVDTKSADKKEELLNSYLSEIINVQTKLTVEKQADNSFQLAQENIKLAQESEENNQWTKAVEFWQKALESLAQVPNNSLVSQDATNLEQTVTKNLVLAEISLTEAVKQEEIREELNNICSGSEEICTYEIDKKKLKSS